MIDLLKMRQIAVGNNIYSNEKTFVTLNTDGLFYKCNEHGDLKEAFIVDANAKDMEWTILHRIVSIAEAMHAYHAGFEVVLHTETDELHFHKSGMGNKVNKQFNDFVNGKWSVVPDMPSFE